MVISTAFVYLSSYAYGRNDVDLLYALLSSALYSGLRSQESRSRSPFGDYYFRVNYTFI